MASLRSITVFIQIDIRMNISTPFVEFKGGQYQDGLMASCPVEENE